MASSTNHLHLKSRKPLNEVTTYPPIRLLPTVSEVFEKLLPMIESNGCISNNQFGFRQGHSTTGHIESYEG
jgi:hypothetical protein